VGSDQRLLDENVAADPGPAQDVALALDSFSQAAMEAKYVILRTPVANA
jgi:hypothetical protein